MIERSESRDHIECWEWILLGHDQFVVLMRNVTFDPSLINQVGNDAMGLVHCDFGFANEL